MLNAMDSGSAGASIGNAAAAMQSEQPWFVLSAAHHYDLAASADPAISHFYGFEADQSNGLTFAVPDGCIDIIFDCDPSNPVAKVCGSTLQAREVDLKHEHRYFGMRFALGVLPDFIDASAGELIDQVWSLLDLVPESESVFTQVVSQTAFKEQVAVFSRFYMGKASRQLSGLTLETLKTLCASKGDVRIKQLEDVTGYTCRTLQRRFQGEMGISPKAFARIIRCQAAIHRITHLEGVIFTELAHDLGFSDQSHFLREFKKFVSTTPVAYQRRIKDSAYLERIRQL